jgi:hypothetical protein
MSLAARLRSRATTLRALIAHLVKRGRFVLIPLLIVLLLGSLLLVATQGLGYVAPFVYSLF